MIASADHGSPRETSRGATSAEKLFTQARQLCHEGSRFADVVGEAIDELAAYLKDRFTHQPYVTMATAIGAGYVLGGGMPSIILRGALAIGGRVAVAAWIQRMALQSLSQERRFE